MSNKPLSVDQALVKAKSLARKGDVDHAMQLYRAVLEKFPGNKRAIAGLRSLKSAKPDPDQTILDAGPTQEQINGLIALYNQGRNQEALEQGAALAKWYPNVPLIPNILGAVNTALGRLEEAVTSYAKALQLKPDYAEAHNNLGISLSDLGKHTEAIASYSKALQFKPDFAKAQNNLGNALKAEGKLEEAIASYSKALQLKPDYAEAHNNLGTVLDNLGKHEEAIASLDKALQLKPDYAEAHNNVGHALKAEGKHEEAIASYSKALQLKPDFAKAQRNLGNIKKYEIDDPRVAQMLEFITNPSISDNDRMQFSFALGKAYEDIGDAESSFQHLLVGNSLRKKELGYDIGSDKLLFSLIKLIFGAGDLPTIEDIKPVTERKKRPIFIVGMPRSGTTLVEQILASHSQVYGAGEIDVLNRAIKPVLDDVQRVHVGKLTEDTIRDVRNDYLAELDSLGGDEPSITDKMPLNFRWIGFILTAMPEAKVINLQRDPAATCWSVFKHYFSSKGNGFAYDLVDVAGYYKLYIELMYFWRERFPNRIYDLNYEALTENQEKEIRKLLDYCGLGWEEQCLEFHKTQRAVKTASSVQVRKEMYKGSSDAWRKYEAHITPMLQALEG